MRGEDTEPPDRNNTRPDEHNPERVEKRWPTARELLGKYAKTRDNFQSFIIKSESVAEVETFLARGVEMQYDTWEYQFDGNRVSARRYIWGDLLERLPKDNANYTSYLSRNDIVLARRRATSSRSPSIPKSFTTGGRIRFFIVRP